MRKSIAVIFTLFISMLVAVSSAYASGTIKVTNLCTHKLMVKLHKHKHHGCDDHSWPYKRVQGDGSTVTFGGVHLQVGCFYTLFWCYNLNYGSMNFQATQSETVKTIGVCPTKVNRKLPCPHK